MNSSMEDNKQVIKSVQKSLRILQYILNSTNEVSIKELSDNLNYNSSTIHHILKTMIVEGFISQNNNTKKYRIGYKLFNTFMEMGNLQQYFSEAYNVLEDIVDKIGETTSLFVKSGNSAICVIGKEPNKTLRAFLKVGRKIPLHCTAAGKMFLAFQEDKEIDEFIKDNGLPKYCVNTINDIGKFKLELKDIVRQGFSIEKEEYEEEINAIGVPIFNDKNEIICTMATIGPKKRINNDKLLYIEKILKEKSNKISNLLTNSYF